MSCLSLYLCLYLIGAFPTGRLIARAYGVRIESTGSGNVGATNVARSVGAKAGVATLLGDLLKGVIGAELALHLCNGTTHPVIGAVLVVCGHCLSIPFYLKGGKGVATSLGVLLVIAPLVAMGGILMFTAAFWLSRIVSLASIIAAIAIPLLGLAVHGTTATTGGLALIAILVVGRHHQNIRRLLNNTEPHFSLNKKSE